MSTYKGIKGESIVGRTSNFTSPSTEGQIFYNTTDNVFRTLVSAKSWSAGGTLTTARYGNAGGGTTSAAVIFGGYDTSYQSNLTEEYKEPNDINMKIKPNNLFFIDFIEY